MFNKYNKIMNELQWKYFVGEYGLGEEEKMDKWYKSLFYKDQESLKEMKVLLDNIEKDNELKKDLGANPYHLFSNGLQTIINFKDLKKLVVYKVHVLENSNSLFDTGKTKKEKQLTVKQLDKKMNSLIFDNKKYLSNFSKSFILFTLPTNVKEKDIDMKKLLKNNELNEYKFITDTNTFIIRVK